MDTAEERRRAREAILALAARDRAEGRAPSREKYRGLFPGFEDLVEEACAPPPAGAPARDGHAVTSGDAGATRVAGSAAPSGHATAGGTRLGPYVLMREIGRGGMGVVYEARDTRLPRTVALKVLSPAYAASPHLRLRFEREAALAARLDHPHVCTVYEAGEHEGTAFLAMRYVEGRPLSDLVGASRDSAAGSRVLGLPAAGPVKSRGAARETSQADDLAALLALFEAIALALHAAHEKGLVHRDIKPHNIMVTPAGEPVLLDFGLARAEEGEGQQLTQTGSLMGTPAYMSPEQLTAQRIRLDRRTDVYSLGVTLYECLTLRLPFQAPTVERLYQRILATEPDAASRLNPAVPADLGVVVATAMEKDRDRRYGTAFDLAQDLGRVRRGEPISARPVGALGRLARWARRNPALAGSLGALAVALSGGLGVSLALLRVAASERDAKDDALREASADRDAKERALLESRRAETEKDAALRDSRRRGLVAASAAAEAEDPMRALLLAREAARLGATPEVVGRLNEAIARCPERACIGVDEGFRGGDAWLLAEAGRVVTGRYLRRPAALWDLEGRRIATLEGEPVPEPTPACPGRRLLTVERDEAAPGKPIRRARVYDPDGRLLADLPLDGSVVRSIYLSPYADHLLLQRVDGDLSLRDLGGREIRVLRPQPPLRGYSADVRFVPDGRTLVVRRDRRTVLLDLATGGVRVHEVAKEDLWEARRGEDFGPAGASMLFCEIRHADSGPLTRVLLWHFAEPAPRVLGDCPGVAHAVRLTRDGRQAMVGTDCGIWWAGDLSGEVPPEFRPGAVNSSVLAPSEDAYYTSHQDGTLRRLDLQGRERWRTRCAGGFAVGLAFDAPGRLLFGRFPGFPPRLWEPEGDDVLPWTVTGTGAERAAWLAVSADGARRFVLGFQDPAVMVREFGRDGRLVRTYEGPGAFSLPPACSRDGDRLLVPRFSPGTRTVLLETATGTIVELPFSEGPSFSPAGDRILLPTAEGTRVLDGRGKELRFVGRLRESSMTLGAAHSAFTLDGRWVVADESRFRDKNGVELARGMLIDLEDGTALEIGGTPLAAAAEPGAIDALLAEHRSLAAAVATASPSDGATGKSTVQRARAVDTLLDSARALAMTSDALAKGGADLADRKAAVDEALAATATAHLGGLPLPRRFLEGRAGMLLVDPRGGAALAVPGEGGLWDGAADVTDPFLVRMDRAIPARFAGLGGPADAAAFSPDGELVAAARGRGVRIWTREGALVTTMDGPADRTWRIAFSARGDALAAAGSYEVRAWTTSGAPLLVASLDLGSHPGIKFAPKGPGFAVWRDHAGRPSPLDTVDGTVRVFRPGGGLEALLEHPVALVDVRWLPDGRLLTLALDGVLRTWLPDPGAVMALAEARSTREFTPQERARYGGLVEGAGKK